MDDRPLVSIQTPPPPNPLLYSCPRSQRPQKVHIKPSNPANGQKGTRKNGLKNILSSSANAAWFKGAVP
jgi:hypothetical protein